MSDRRAKTSDEADLVFGLMVALLVILIGAASIGAALAGEFSGVASFYGNESGSRTASGERFDQAAMTAAHRSLQFGTRLRVHHGGRSVVVRINDRGPFIAGRVLDLSTAAAAAIGITRRKGLGRVRAEVIR